MLLVFLLLLWVLSLLFPPFVWRYWYRPVPEGTSMRSPDSIQIARMEREGFQQAMIDGTLAKIMA